MSERVLGFYSELADFYHLMFEDWDDAIARQAEVLDALLRAEGVGQGSPVLDCACGIGTQALGLTRLGYRVSGSDLSAAAVARAAQEAERLGLALRLYVSDMRSLAEIDDDSFAAVIAMDNALPHLPISELPAAFRAMRGRLRRDGLLVASIRDYDRLMAERPAIQTPMFYGKPGERRIVHQVWDWVDERSYRPHLYITCQAGEEWTTHHFAGEYHGIRREELSRLMSDAGFRAVEWRMPEQTGYYQPLVVARG